MSLSDFPDALLSRRGALAASVGALVASCAKANEMPSVRVGLLPFGTVQWEIKTLVDHGFDREADIEVEAVPLASIEAARIAFLSGSVDTVVNDLLFAARLKAEGKPVLFMPHTSTEGGLVVAAASPIKSLADLKGKSIGVSGGPIEKNWLVMRAVALKQAGLDLTKDARPVFGAPPLLAAKVESGELDCGLLYWTQAARLEAKGYRSVTTVEEMLAALGVKGRIAIGGYLLKPETKPDVLIGFGRAVRRTEALLADDPDAWTKLRPLMQAPDQATFEALRAAYIRGIPRKPRAEEIADAKAFFATMVELGGSALVGSATSLPDDLYVDQAVYG